jgi:putative transposase
MPAGTITPPFLYEAPEAEQQLGQVVAYDLGIKTLAVGVNEQGRFYHIGGFKGHQWYNKQLDKIRSKRARCQKKSRRYPHLSQVYQRVFEQKRNKRRDCLRAPKEAHNSLLYGYSLTEAR